MKASCVCVSLVLGSAAAFQSFMGSSLAVRSARSSLRMEDRSAEAPAEKKKVVKKAAPKAEDKPKEPVVFSKSVPFVAKPQKLDGLVGAAEFDPLYFSEFFPVKYLQESEIKHGRVAMLAVVGFIVSEIIHLPGAAYSASNPVDAPALVGAQPLLQIFAFCGFLEFLFHKGKVTVEDMHDNGEEPGDFGFDPLGVSKDAAKLARSRLSEIKNGRLAMLAIGGLIHQSIITGHGVPLN